MSLKKLQAEFIEFLSSANGANEVLAERADIAQRVKAQGSVSNATRLNIYANAYRLRLVEAIDNDHPVLGGYLGDDLFDKMISGFLQENPSKTYSLRYFADALPEFLASHSPFDQHPVLADLARFERRLLDAFDAPDSDRKAFSDLQACDPELWPSLTLRLHPSVQVLLCATNAVEIWQALKAEQLPPNADAQAKTWLLWRNRDRLTEFYSLSDLELALMTGLLNGQTIAQLCECLAEQVNEADVGVQLIAYLQKWFQHGLIAHF